MPKLGELKRKLRQLAKGYEVKAPKAWFDKMLIEVREQYPSYDEDRLQKIVAGIWVKMPLKAKKEIVKEYQGE